MPLEKRKMEIVGWQLALAKFLERESEVFEFLGSTKQAVTLTVAGNAVGVLIEPGAYQRLLDLAALASEEEALRQADEQIARGQCRPAAEVFAEFRAKYGIPG